MILRAYDLCSAKRDDSPQPYYVSPLTERWGHVALPLSAQFDRSACVCALHPIVQAVKHETLTQCWANFDPPSATLAQHQASTGSTLRVCWVSVCQSVLW